MKIRVTREQVEKVENAVRTWIGVSIPIPKYFEITIDPSQVVGEEINVPYCTGCGLPWMGPEKASDRCWCDPSPGHVMKPYRQGG